MEPVEVVRAEFESKCAACGSEIYPGDEIVLVDDEWVHADCALEDD